MKRTLTLCAIGLCTVLLGHAQEITTSESWSGCINVGARELNICFVINTTPDGQQSCTMDVPDQGAKEIPVELLKNDSDSLNISIPILRATYKGRKVSADMVEGTFTQNGMSLPLSLKPGGFEVRRPQTPVGPFAYDTEEVVFSNDAEGAELSGTLTYPVNYDAYKKKSVPVVLMVSGSGEQNRNEEVFDHKPFLVIADFLGTPAKFWV